MYNIYMYVYIIYMRKSSRIYTQFMVGIGPFIDITKNKPKYDLVVCYSLIIPMLHVVF